MSMYSGATVVGLVGLAVILPIVVLVVTVSGVMLFTDYRRRRREKGANEVLKELQYIHHPSVNGKFIEVYIKLSWYNNLDYWPKIYHMTIYGR